MKNNPFVEIENELSKIDDILEKRLENYKEARAEISQKLQEKNIKIMFFGAYNAGKSTLINSILKDKKAKIGDVPTTDSVDVYLWNDYKLLDTPGINAPIAHEAISKEQLNKSDLVVFVIRKDDEDSSSTYKEIFDLLKKEKDVFLVFNYSGLDKTGVGEGSVQLSIQRLNSIMLSEAKKYEITDKLLESIELIPINLKTALKARLENKLELLEHANYHEFEERFTLWLSQYNSEHQILKTLKTQIENQLLSPAINGIEESHTELDGLVEGLALLTSQKENLKIDIEVFVQNKISILLPRVIDFLKNDDTELVENELLNIYKEIEIYLSKILKESISMIERERLQLQNSEVVTVLDSRGIDFDPNILLPIITTLPLPPQIKIIVVAVFGMISSIFGGDDKETDIENERQRAKALQISQATQNIRNRILTSILKQSKKLIDKSFQDSIDEINEEIANEKENISREESMRTLLNEARVKIHSINF